MAITRRATEDFRSGVRTEFRRLVDEITESRAFIQRLEKMLGEEIEQKSTCIEKVRSSRRRNVN